ncbi:MAG TPA: sigma-70 family RNA polymerase sigma factor [Anaerolineales bacterium]|nr:sigma-70 family RNA polymerase sigma factor [Anaerolineales bacterium]HRF47193.1 sigma-70 family RNA polymerase sigma factor [Anaerolineales bacterium]
MDEPGLIRDAQGGDLDAFNRLVLAYQNLAYNVAYRIMGDSASASDATQDAFIAAYRHLPAYRGGSFKAWLMRIVTNACYDELRRRQRRPATSLEDLVSEDGPDLESERSLASPDDGPEEIAQRREVANAIQECLNNLPEEMRLVTVLCDVQGFDYSEIATSTGLALGTVKSRLSRARARLRDCLQGVRELLPAIYRLSDEASV